MDKKVSLISPILNESSIMGDALSNLESFVQKIPLRWQWVLANSGNDPGLKDLKSDKIELKILNLPPKTNRAQALQKALKASDGDYIAIMPVDFTIPLAELFSFLQELVTADDVDIAIGNRYTAKKVMQSQKSSWHQTLEKIINEKHRHLPQTDVLCSYMIFRRSALDKLLPELNLKAWYYSLDILKLAQAKQLKVIQVPVLSRDKRISKIPLLREYLRHLF